jgi:hypothetical protein
MLVFSLFKAPRDLRPGLFCSFPCFDVKDVISEHVRHGKEDKTQRTG